MTILCRTTGWPPLNLQQRLHEHVSTLRSTYTGYLVGRFHPSTGHEDP